MYESKIEQIIEIEPPAAPISDMVKQWYLRRFSEFVDRQNSAPIRLWPCQDGVWRTTSDGPAEDIFNRFTFILFNSQF